MGVSRGKQFEAQIRKALEQDEDTSVDRLADPMAGYAGIRNLCDFIVYRYPNEYYFECKAFSGNTLNFEHAITKDQWQGLQEKSKKRGIKAGIIVWFIDHNITAYVPIQQLVTLKEQGARSLNVRQLYGEQIECYVLPAKKKRVLFEYDMLWLLNILGDNNGKERQ